MTCTYSPEAYVFGSEENHALLEAETNELLHFGHNFPAPQGGSYWLDGYRQSGSDPKHPHVDHLPHGARVFLGVPARRAGRRRTG